MSRIEFDHGNNQKLIVGWDDSTKSYWAQLVDPSYFYYEDGALETPVRAVGYSDAEKKLDPSVLEYGPFPINTPNDLYKQLVKWNIALSVRVAAHTALKADLKKRLLLKHHAEEAKAAKKMKAKAIDTPF